MVLLQAMQNYKVQTDKKTRIAIKKRKLVLNPSFFKKVKIKTTVHQKLILCNSKFPLATHLHYWLAIYAALHLSIVMKAFLNFQTRTMSPVSSSRNLLELSIKRKILILTRGPLSNQANMIKVKNQQKNYSHKNPKVIQIRVRIVNHKGL